MYKGPASWAGPRGSQPVELSLTQKRLFTWVPCVDRCLFVPVKPARRRCCGLNGVDVIRKAATRPSQNTALIRYWWPAQIIFQCDVFTDGLRFKCLTAVTISHCVCVGEVKDMSNTSQFIHFLVVFRDQVDSFCLDSLNFELFFDE